MDRAWAPPGPAMLFAAALAGCLLSSVLAVCVPSDAVFPGGCKLQVMSSPYLAIHWIPTAGVEPTVQLGMESEPSSYSAVAFGGTSGMDGSYIILGYNDGSTGFVGTYRGQGHVTPVSTSDVTITDAQTRTQDGVMIWSATLTLSIPNAPAKSLSATQGNNLWVAIGRSGTSAPMGLASGQHRFAQYAGSVAFTAAAAATPAPTPASSASPTPVPAFTQPSWLVPPSSSGGLSAACGYSTPSTLGGFACMAPLASDVVLHWSDAQAARRDPNGAITLALQGPAASYLAFGWSSTGDMVPGYAVVGFPGTGGVSSYHMTSYTVDGVTPTDAVAVHGGAVTVVGNTMTVTFTIATKESPGLDLSRANDVLWALGPGQAAKRRSLAQTALAMHAAKGRLSLVFEGPDLIGRGASLPLTRNARIILIHACLLALPFAFLLPSASLAMLARRGLPQGLACDRIFATHWVVQALAMVLAVSGGIYMTVMSPKYPGTLSRAHAVLGFTLLSAAVIQMTWGFSRPKVPEGYEGARALGEDKPLHRRRRVFELGHRTLGWLVVLGGVAQCWVGYAVVRQMGNDAGRYVVPVLVILLEATVVVAFALIKFRTPPDDSDD